MGVMAIKARQDETTTALTSEIEACFEVIEAISVLSLGKNFPYSKPSKLDFWQHQMQLSRLTIQVQEVSTSSSFNQTDLKPVSVLLQPIALSYKPSGNLWQSLATGDNPHRPIGTFYGALCPRRTFRPFPKQARPLVPGQSDDLSERAL